MVVWLQKCWCALIGRGSFLFEAHPLVAAAKNEVSRGMGEARVVAV